MSFKAKRKTVFRIIGSLFILVGLILSIIYYLILNLVPFQVILIITPWILQSSFSKLEVNLFVNNKDKVHLILCIYTFGIGLLTFLWNLINFLNLFCITTSILALLVCWHFALSLYRKEKIYFIGGGVIYIIITIFYRTFVYIQHSLDFFYFFEVIMEVIFVSLGMILILIIEYILYRKGYLNYIQI